MIDAFSKARSWCVLVVGGGWTTATCGSSEIVPRPSVVPCFCLGVSEDRNWGPGSGSAWKQFCVLGVLTASSGTGCGRRRRESVGFALDGPAVSSRVCVKAHSLELTDWTTQGRKVRSRHRATRNPFRDCWHRWGSEPLRVPCEGTWVCVSSSVLRPLTQIRPLRHRPVRQRPRQARLRRGRGCDLMGGDVSRLLFPSSGVLTVLVGSPALCYRLSLALHAPLVVCESPFFSPP